MDEVVKNKNIISFTHKFLSDDNESDNPVDKEEANPDGDNDWKLTDDYSGVQEVPLDELDTAENKKEELSENTEEEAETEKKDNYLKELKKKEAWNKSSLRGRHPSQPLKPHDAAGGSVCKSPTLKDPQDDIKADSPSSLCTFVLICLVVFIFGSYWAVVKQSDNKQIQFQCVNCNDNLDRALKSVANITQQLNEMTRAREHADKLAQDTERELKQRLYEMIMAKERVNRSAQDTEKQLKQQLDEMTNANAKIAKEKEHADKSARDTEKQLKKQLDELTKAKEHADRSAQDIEKQLKQQLDEMTKANAKIAKEKEHADNSAQDTEKQLKKQLDELTKAKERAVRSAQDTEKQLRQQLDEIAKARERADKSARDTEKQLEKMTTIAEQLKQQLNTKNNELAAKVKELNKFTCGVNRK